MLIRKHSILVMAYFDLGCFYMIILELADLKNGWGYTINPACWKCLSVVNALVKPQSCMTINEIQSV